MTFPKTEGFEGTLRYAVDFALAKCSPNVGLVIVS